MMDPEKGPAGTAEDSFRVADRVLRDDDVDIESWLSSATPDEVRVPICLNRSLMAEFDGLMAEYEISKPLELPGIETKMMDKDEFDDKLREMQARLVELKKLIEEDERAHIFVFRKGDYKEWRQIIEMNPPTEQQTERYQGLIDHNPDQAGPALVSFSCVKPKMSVAQAERLQASLPENIWARLYQASIQVNRTGTEIPKYVLRTVDQLATELKSIMPVPTPSPSASSADAAQSTANQSGRSTTGKSPSSGKRSKG